MTCGEYVENMLIFAQYSTHILSNQQLATSTPVEPPLLKKLSIFFTFILGAHSYYPRGPIMRKGKSSNLKIG